MAATKVGAESTSPQRQGNTQLIRGAERTANSIPAYTKIRDQRQRTLKDLTVRRVLKDNKVPGPGTARYKAGRSASPGAGAAAGVLGEGQAAL